MNNDSLSSEQKQRILNEELYRIEIKQQFEKKEELTNRQKIWAFLNSTFGLWLLSTVAVGFITWSYTEWTKNKSQESNQAELIRKLDAEITSRINFFDVSLNNVQNFEQYFSTFHSFFYRQKDANEDTVFQEFNVRNLRSLLVEQFQLVSESEKPDIHNAIKGVDRLVAYRMRIQKNNENPQAPLSTERQEELNEIKEIINTNLKISRWKTTDK